MEIEQAKRDLIRAARDIGRAQLKDMLSGPCGYFPGTAHKIAVMEMRNSCGISLWNKSDAGVYHSGELAPTPKPESYKMRLGGRA